MLWRFPLLLALAVLPGCSFHKTITNDHVRSLDASSIEVGKTTQMEVLETLGPPAPVMATESALKNVSERHFVYSCWESREFELLVAYILFLPFQWSDFRSVEDLVVEFDERGIVSDLYRVKDHCIWRPFRKDAGRGPAVVEGRTGRVMP